jgi:ADP-heptose:LPS heptosyltransferase
MLCLVPAARALRDALPEATIVLIGVQSARRIAERFPNYFDEFIGLEAWPGIPELRDGHPRAGRKTLESLRRRRFDLAIQMHGSGVVTNRLTARLGARRSAGSYIPGYALPDRETFIRYPDREPEIVRLMRVLENIGVPARGLHLEFPLRANDVVEADSVGLPRLGTFSYVCVHPGSRSSATRWDPASFARVADALAERGLAVVLTGSRDEAYLTNQVVSAMKHAAIDLGGRLSLGGLGAALSRARLLVCNDTGVSHMASALRVPSVVVFTASDPNRWSPLDASLHVSIGAVGAQVDPSTVVVAAERLLQTELPRACA